MKTHVNAFIIEDELMHRTIVTKKLKDFSSKSGFLTLDVFPIDNYIDVYSNPNNLSMASNDIFIIDIHLHSFFNGIQLAQKIRTLNPTAFILFLTSDTTKGIEVINERINPVGYIVKQTNGQLLLEDEFVFFLSQIEQELRGRSKDVLTVKSSGRKHMVIPVSDIVYIASIKGQKRKVSIKTNYREIICSEKISNLKDELADDGRFYKELKSFIINFDFVLSYNQLEGVITFEDHSELHFGTKVITKFNKAIMAYQHGGK